MNGSRTGGQSPRVRALYRSDGHNFVGRHGLEPGGHVMESVAWIECVAGRGVMGDRYFDHGDGYKGQITFFAWEVHETVCQEFGLGLGPEVYRRNVLVAGVDLDAWIGCRFEVQGIGFEGVEECRPCYWMDRVVAPGVEQFLKGRGGLRARILRDGRMRVEDGGWRI